MNLLASQTLRSSQRPQPTTLTVAWGIGQALVPLLRLKMDTRPPDHAPQRIVVLQIKNRTTVMIGIGCIDDKLSEPLIRKQTPSLTEQFNHSVYSFRVAWIHNVDWRLTTQRRRPRGAPIATATRRRRCSAGLGYKRRACQKVTLYSPRNMSLLNRSPKPNPTHNPEAISPATSEPWSVSTRGLRMTFKNGKRPNMNMNKPTMILARRLVVCALIAESPKKEFE